VLLLAAAIVPLLVYAHTATFGFLLDDHVLFQTSPSLRTLASVPAGFATDVGALRKGSPTVLGSYYRPLFLALSTLYYQVVGGRPMAWHVAAVLLAAAVGALAYLFFTSLGFSPRLALLGSAVFSLHPAHVSSVAWASGLQELLAALFTFLALGALLGRPGRHDDTMAIAAAAGAFVCALLSKEVAVGLLPLVVLWAVAGRAGSPEESRRFGRAAVVLGGVTVLYLLARLAVFGGLAKPWPRAPGLAASLPSVPVAFTTYLRLLAWPSDLSFFRPERPIWGPLDAPVLVSLLVVALLGGAAYAAIRWNRRTLLPLGWLIVWLLPVLNLWALDPSLMVSDRYLFLPALALPWLLMVLVPARAAVPVLAVLAVLFGGLSLRYVRIFADERTFVAAMEQAEPTSALVFAEKSRLLLRDGKPAEGEAALARSLALEPLDGDRWQTLGDLQMRRGDLDAAEASFRRALVVAPHASRPFKLLVLARARAGQAERAFTLVEECARRWPTDFEVQLLHALFLGTRGERGRAEQAFERARRLRPWEPAVRGGLDAALASLGHTVAQAPRVR
jgi:cytochrome c-type biogenesis protein CcmH/NrfG